MTNERRQRACLSSHVDGIGIRFFSVQFGYQKDLAPAVDVKDGPIIGANIAPWDNGVVDWCLASGSDPVDDRTNLQREDHQTEVIANQYKGEE